MEAVGQLAGGVAHDFNNLLTVIGTYTTMMIESCDETDARREDLLEIMGAATRAATLTRQLLAFGRRQLLDARVINLNDVVAGLEKMLRRVISEEIELEIVLDRDLGAVHADSGQVEQVLMNLVVNARDAMPRGGKLTIETRNADGGSRAEIGPRTAAPPVPMVMLSVTDTGVGMDDRTMGRIFEPFFTTKEPGRGTGLGLSTTYGIIKQSGGQLRVRSRVGVGTTFEAVLPRVVAAQELEEYAGNVDGGLRGSELILVAEDDESVRRIIVRTLRKLGYEVIEAANGHEAMSASLMGGKVPDLLLTDVVMPSISGRALADALRNRWPGLPVLFTSAYATDGNTGETANNLPGVLLRKPFVPGELAAAVRVALARVSP
jgi:CheY-like chemotaxis protein